LAVTGWALGLAAAGLGYGRIGLGTALAGAFFLQVIPSVWTAYRSRHLVGVSVGTWLLIFGELACFGLFGVVESDPRLITLGATGVCASILMVSRVAWARWTRLPAACRDVSEPAGLTSVASASWRIKPGRRFAAAPWG